MEASDQAIITIETTVQAPVEKVWAYWNEPQHITKWNTASEEWHTTKAENDLRVGGNFSSRMEAKDGSFGFDFGGVYDEVNVNELIAYTMGDGRKVKITFTSEGDTTKIVEVFDAEASNPVEMQQAGWQAILNNFKKYSESN
ncbi:SRPBCC family protein [Paenibacillus sp. N1-5-1-14]|uniref:SRPBCC family protein n=1 Tax=Paenibacillus radicibacter TaxID=2972488 RepID=UPI0021593D2C|nr:SRPBCC family protein [Paenibacillus radicibacter]MCR8642914.1 SRPBCC family protein [Paenibacillus radicibacter]